MATTQFNNRLITPELTEALSSYGIVTGLQETEYGYQSATEMASITYDASEYGLGTLRIEQDKDFKPCTLAEIEDAEMQAFLSRLYDKD